MAPPKKNGKINGTKKLKKKRHVSAINRPKKKLNKTIGGSRHENLDLGDMVDEKDELIVERPGTTFETRKRKLFTKLS